MGKSNYVQYVLSLVLAAYLALFPLCLAVTYADDTPTPTPTEFAEGSVTPAPENEETQPSEPDPTPTSEPEVTSDGTVSNNEASVETEITATAETGSNTITDPTPTASPSDLLDSPQATESAIGESEATQSASAQSPPATKEQTGSSESTGGSSSRTSSDNSPSAGPSVVTGTAASVAIVEQSINTTEINASTIHQTINIFVPNEDDIDLRLIVLKATAETLSGPRSSDETVNVGVTVSNDVVYLENSIVSRAMSGQNKTVGEDSSIKTGDATSIVSLINSVNTTIINSVIHFYTINIFSVESGNILLPELTSSGSDCCQGSIETINGKTDVLTTVTSTATSGNNSIEGTGTIVSGDARSIVNVATIADATFINTALYQLYINVFGVWDGTFRGWDTITAESGGASISLFGYSESPDTSSNGCCSDTVSIENKDVTVRTNITGEAITGGNSASGSNSEINTGNAFSAVHVLNLINTSFINSSGVFAFINIFGRLSGDIGGASTFEEASVTPTPEPEKKQDSDTRSEIVESKSREQGGKLSVTNENNVGSFVYPGDTVTFFVKVKNVGTGMVYDSGIDLFLMNEYGDQVGGRHYALGNIALNSGSKLTTGFVLSPQTPPGTYTARAVASGTIGSDNSKISAFADSTFVVFGSEYAVTNTDDSSVPPDGTPEVKGVSYEQAKSGNILHALLVQLLLIPLFLGMKVSEIRRKLLFVFSKNQDVLEKLRTLQLLLL